MSNEDIRAAVLKAFARIAPEANLDELDPRADVREALDIDSMDFNLFVLAIHDSLKVDIADRDYPKFFTLDGAVAELQERLAAVGR
jgi:acyl carrier protein